MDKREVNISCGLCERPVTGVHYLWDNVTSCETTIWFHGDGDEDVDQCFMSKGSKSLISAIRPVGIPYSRNGDIEQDQ